MTRPGSRVVLVVAAIAAVGACSGAPGSGAGAADPPRADGWSQVDLDGSVRSMVPFYPSGVVVAGRRDDGGSLLEVVGGGEGAEVGFPDTPERFELGGLSAIALDGDVVTGVGDLDPSAGTAADYWISDLYADAQEYEVGAPRTRDGADPVWLVPLQDGEGDVRAMGATRAGDRWRVHAWELFEEWKQLEDVSPQLYLDAVPGSRTFLVGNTEAAVVVAGRLAVGVEGKPEVGVWIAGDGTDPGPWTRLRTSSQPDRITDVSDWDVGLWIAGARHGRPVVYEFTLAEVAPMLDVPPAALDPEEPTVLVARQPIGEDPLVIAVQSVEGPALWVPDDPGWREFPAPAGRLEDAVVVGRTAYLVIDGRLWRQQLPAGLVPED